MIEPTKSMIPPEKDALQQVHKLVDAKLRVLKMDETAHISCGKIGVEAVRSYVWAYALHKGKWFDTEYDATNKNFDSHARGAGAVGRA